jgi:WD40 repeat protein
MIHRDVKPANILLAPEAERPGAETGKCDWTHDTPKLTDFGLVKRLDASAGMTGSGHAIGTPHYIAPEALGGWAVTPAYDLYAVGVLLYQLLTGRPPFQGTSTLAILQQALSQEAASPSRLASAVPRDLETICLKCLDKEPRRRYETASHLADDLERYLRGEPILARPAGTWERCRKWTHRKPAVAGLLALLLVVGVTGLAGVLWEWRDAVAAKQHAEAMEGDAIRARDRARESEKAARRQTAERSFDRGVALAEEGRIDAGLHWILESLREAPDDAVELHSLARINLAGWSQHRHRLRHYLPHGRSVVSGAFHPEGRLLATGSSDQFARLWDLESDRLVGQPMGPLPGVVQLVAFSSDGKALLTANGALPSGLDSPAYLVQRWDTSSCQSLGPPTTVDGRSRFLFAVGPEGNQAVTLLHDAVGNRLSSWDLVSGKRLATLHTPEYPRELALGPDGRSPWGILANPWVDKPSTLWKADFDNGTWRKLPAIPPDAAIWSSRFHRGGRTLHSYADVVQVRDSKTAMLKAEPVREPEDIFDALFLADGRGFAAATGTGIFLHDSTTGQRLGDFSHHGPGRFLSLSPDGRFLAGLGQYSARFPVAADQFARVWELARPPSRPAPAFEAAVPPGSRGGLYTHARFSPDRRWLALLGASADDPVVIWDCLHERPAGLAAAGVSRPAQIAFDGDGRKLLCAGREIDLVASDSGVITRRWPLAEQSWLAAAWHPDGRRLALGTYGKDVVLTDVSDPLQFRRTLKQSDWVHMVAFHPAGKFLAVGTQNERSDHSEVRLWDVETGQAVGIPRTFPEGQVKAAYRTDGKSLFATNGAKSYLLDGTTGEVRSEMQLVQGCTAFAFGSDNRLLATAGGGGTLQLWDAQTGAHWPGSASMPHPRRSRATCLAINSDESIVLVGHADGTARLWDIATSRPLGPPVVQHYPLLAVAFTPDGRSFRTVATDGRTRPWRIPTASLDPVEQLVRRLELDSCLTLDDGQSLVLLSQAAWQERRDQVPRSSAVADETAWHESCALDAEEDEDEYGGLWHLERLQRSPQKSPTLALRQAAFHLLAGRIDEANRLWEQAAPQLSSSVLTAWCRWQISENSRLKHDAAKAWWQSRIEADKETAPLQ